MINKDYNYKDNYKKKCFIMIDYKVGDYCLNF